MKTEMLFGVHPVVEALKAGRREIAEILTAKEKQSARLESAVALAESLGISVKKLPLPTLSSVLSTDQHQGIAARVSPYPCAEITQILSLSGADSSGCFVLIADSISDTHNLGALIRTALCAGVHGIIIPKDRSATPTPAVSGASAGALEHILLAQVTNLVAAIKELKESGLWIAGADAAADQTVFDADLTGSVAVVIGGEEKGIRPLVKSHCDFLIRIPQKGGLNSLNASVAGAVIMYEVFRQRAMVKRGN